jgi:hypothetical protein
MPAGLDAVEAVAVVLNYVSAHQMLHRSVKARTAYVDPRGLGWRWFCDVAVGGVLGKIVLVPNQPSTFHDSVCLALRKKIKATDEACV